MALYLPQQDVAIEIDDDPYSLPVDRDAYPTAKVIHATCADICDIARMGRLGRTVAHEAGEPVPAAAQDSDAWKHLAGLLFGGDAQTPQTYMDARLRSARRERIEQARMQPSNRPAA